MTARNYWTMGKGRYSLRNDIVASGAVETLFATIPGLEIEGFEIVSHTNETAFTLRHSTLPEPTHEDDDIEIDILVDGDGRFVAFTWDESVV